MNNFKHNYNPLYFLASLGAGGLAISFFMYLQYMIPHKKMPLVTFEHIFKVIEQGGLNSILTSIVVFFILGFSIIHLFLLFKNIGWYRNYKKTEDYKNLKKTISGMSLMAVPLTLAMTINVLFVLGAAFVPNLWDSVEYLFPFALLAFLAVGLYALSIFSKQMLRIILEGDLNYINTSNLSQLLAVFAFTMISVGFAGSGAMSHNIVINAFGLFFAIFFLSLAVVLLISKLILGFRGILKNGIDKETSPTIWMVIPILTLIGITLIRILMGLDHHLEANISYSTFFVLTSIIVSLQILNLLFGYKIMIKNNYFKDFVKGVKKSVGSLGLICPGVALFVFGIFFIHLGLVKNHIIDKYTMAYYISFIPFIFIQITTVYYFFKLVKKNLFKV